MHSHLSRPLREVEPRRLFLVHELAYTDLLHVECELALIHIRVVTWSKNRDARYGVIVNKWHYEGFVVPTD